MKFSSVLSHSLLLAYISATSSSVSEIPVSTAETPSKSRWFGGWWGSSSKSQTTAEQITSSSPALDEPLVSIDQTVSVELPSRATETVSTTEQPPSQEASSTWARYNPLSYFWSHSTAPVETKTEVKPESSEPVTVGKDKTTVETSQTFDFATEKEPKPKKTLALVPKKRAVNPSLGSIVSHFDSTEGDSQTEIDPAALKKIQKRDKKSAKRRAMLRNATSLKDAISLGANSIFGGELSMMDALAESRISSVVLASQSEDLLRRKAAYQMRTQFEEQEMGKQRGKNANVMDALKARLEKKRLLLDEASTEADGSVTEEEDQVPVKKELSPQPRKLRVAGPELPPNMSGEGKAPRMKRSVKPVASEGGQDALFAELKARFKKDKK